MQVVRLQTKIAMQGSQVATQSSRSEVQSRLHGQALGHWVVTPSQVTNPRWCNEQFWSADEQLVVLLLPLQWMVPPDPQFAEAVQRALSGRVAMGVGAGVPREARKALSAGAACGGVAAIAGGARKPRTARVMEKPRAILFIAISFRQGQSQTLHWQI
jgi:hypothetical protein